MLVPRHRLQQQPSQGADAPLHTSANSFSAWLAGNSSQSHLISQHSKARVDKPPHRWDSRSRIVATWLWASIPRGTASPASCVLASLEGDTVAAESGNIGQVYRVYTDTVVLLAYMNRNSYCIILLFDARLGVRRPCFIVRNTTTVSYSSMLRVT